MMAKKKKVKFQDSNIYCTGERKQLACSYCLISVISQRAIFSKAKQFSVIFLQYC